MHILKLAMAMDILKLAAAFLIMLGIMALFRRAKKKERIAPNNSLKLETKKRLTFLPYLIFIIFMLLKFYMITYYYIQKQGYPNGDAYDYIPRAHFLWKYGHLPNVKETESLGMQQQAIDCRRPPGYAIILAPFFMFGESDENINFFQRHLDATLDLVITTIVFCISLVFVSSLFIQCIAAFLFGIQPWTSGYVSLVVPDIVASLLIVLGVVQLSIFVVCQQKRRAYWHILLGSAFLSVSFMFRPETALAVPPLILIALFCRRLMWKDFIRYGICSILPFMIVIMGNVWYQHHLDGSWTPFREYKLEMIGLRRWSSTWTASFELKKDILWQINKFDPGSLPNRAFDNDTEKNVVQNLFKKIKDRGFITESDDQAFMKIAEDRIHKSPLRYYFWIRLDNTIRYWLNYSSALWLSNMYLPMLPPVIESSIRFFFFLLRIAALFLCFWSFLYLCYHVYVAATSWSTCFILLGMAFILIRTAFFAFYTILPENRYMVPAWPFVLVAAVQGMNMLYLRGFSQPRRGRLP